MLHIPRLDLHTQGLQEMWKSARLAITSLHFSSPPDVLQIRTTSHNYFLFSSYRSHKTTVCLSDNLTVCITSSVLHCTGNGWHWWMSSSLFLKFRKTYSSIKWFLLLNLFWVNIEVFHLTGVSSSPLGLDWCGITEWSFKVYTQKEKWSQEVGLSLSFL